MSRKRYGATLVLLAVAFFMGGTISGKSVAVRSVQAHQSRAMKRDTSPKYEVRVVNAATAQGLADEANKLGEQGWELVSVIIDDGKGYALPYTAYLKRAK